MPGSARMDDSAPATSRLLALARHHLDLHQPGGDLHGQACCLRHDSGDGAEEDDLLAALDDLLTQQRAAQCRSQQQRAVLEEVLAQPDLRIALQPVVDLVSGRCTSVEALARFPLGMGSPDVAFAVAERVGLRFELERLAAQQALELLPLLAPDQALAINLSPDVAVRLMRHAPDDLPLEHVILEVTEHVAVPSYARLRERIRPLRERGLRLAVDDAGAGFSSLRHIVELQPDIIKIDRSLVADLDHDLARRSVVTTFVLLALDIGASVVAEGVETRGELDAVASLGVDAAQGFLLARPTTDRDALRHWTSGSLLPRPPDALVRAG